MYVWIKNVILMLKLLAYITQETFCFLYSWSFSNGFGISLRWFMLISFCYCYLVDPASSHTLVLKIKPCMSKCFVFITLDCGRLIITVIVLLRLLYRWIPVVIAFFGGDYPLGNPPIDRWFTMTFPPNDRWISWVIPLKFNS